MSRREQHTVTVTYGGTPFTLECNFWPGFRSYTHDVPDDPDELEITSIRIGDYDAEDVFEALNQTARYHLEACAIEECKRHG